ncbi:carbohydrate ABC transporter permease [Halocatena halophila]|uniref:carbohydrate ABC transporter permease n=1 Tax=Halocatena halophila TaxID=2814576 RepID=UPI002ED24157
MADNGSNFDIRSIVDGMNHRRLGIYVFVTVFIAFFLVPLETGIMTALKSTEAINRSLPFLPPAGDGFTLANLELALEQVQRGVINSLLMALPATIINIVLASMAAYGLTLVDWRGQIGVLLLFVAGVFVPYQAVIVPLARFWTHIFPITEILSPLARLVLVEPYHLELIPLMITHVAYGIPIITVLFRSYYKSMPKSLIEAGKIDGKSVTQIYRDIVLPLSKPMFGVVFIYQFTQIYNEFLFSKVLIGSASAQQATVTLILPQIGASTSGLDYGLRMSAAFLAALPTLLLYIAFAEQFAEGLKTGGA